MTIEDALDELYQGRTNVALQALNLGISITELQQEFAAYVSARPIDSGIWQKDIELSWPYIT